jgi:hypothetical protein
MESPFCTILKSVLAVVSIVELLHLVAISLMDIAEELNV